MTGVKAGVKAASPPCPSGHGGPTTPRQRAEISWARSCSLKPIVMCHVSIVLFRSRCCCCCCLRWLGILETLKQTDAACNLLYRGALLRLQSMSRASADLHMKEVPLMADKCSLAWPQTQCLHAAEFARGAFLPPVVWPV